MQELRIRITGIAPLLMHNSRRSLNPKDELTRAFKALSGKRGKTEEDQEKISDMEFMLGLYTNENAEPILPGDVLEATFIQGAKKTKSGKQAAYGMHCDDAKLIYNGPKNADGLLADPRFRDVRPVAVQRARIARTRPIFKDWSAVVTVHFNPSVANKQDVLKWIEAAGATSGVGDFRPKFGRFIAEEVI